MDIHLVASEFKDQQYPLFTRLRAENAIHKISLPEDREGWLITRYEDAEIILKDRRFIKDIRKSLSPAQIAESYGWLLEPGKELSEDADPTMTLTVLNVDPPNHTRLRALINLSFTPRFVERWRERIQAIVDELLDRVAAKGEMELINEFAFPLPMTVITEMLGIPAKDHPRFREWSSITVEAVGNPQAMREIRGKLLEFRAYLLELIQEKRKQAGTDLISRLVQAELEGDILTESEMVNMVVLLLIAGHETTANLIGNGMLALLEHPDQRERLQQDPTLINTAIEELLRYYSPLNVATQRWAAEDIELHGVQIRRGDYIVMSLCSANRDTEIFPDAVKLDITREENHHLAFGKGIHYCLGAPLARLEGQIAINTLLARFPNLRLKVDRTSLVWRPGALMLGLRALPLKF